MEVGWEVATFLCRAGKDKVVEINRLSNKQHVSTSLGLEVFFVSLASFVYSCVMYILLPSVTFTSFADEVHARRG